MKPTTLIVLDWAIRSFGPQHVYNRSVRALRLVEEAVELGQAYDLPREKIVDLVNMIYARPKGSAAQELGGVMLTATVLAAAQGIEVQDVMLTELRRVLSKPPDHFAKLNQEKIDLGFA